MEGLKRVIKSRKFAFAAVSFLPLCLVVLGVILLVGHTVINRSFLLTFVFVPVLALFLLYFTVFSKIKTGLKVSLSVLILIFSAFMFLLFYLFGLFEEHTYYKNEEAKSAYSEIEDVYMPKLSEVGDPINIEYHYYFSVVFTIFDNNVDTLICRYDEENYAKQKKLLDEKYIFQNEAMVSEGYSCKPTADIDGYSFRVLSHEEYDMYYPKHMVLIATNDKENEILYMSHYADDLDYIESLEDFIKDDCGWKHIR